MTDEPTAKGHFDAAYPTSTGTLKNRHPIWEKIQENGEHPYDIIKTMQTFTTEEIYEALHYYVEWIAIYQGYLHADDNDIEEL